MSETSRKVWVRKGAGYTAGLILSVAGLMLLLWEIWAPYFGLPTDLGIGLTLIPRIFLSGLLVLLGLGLVAAKRRGVPLIEEATALLKCPSCKTQWREPMAKAHLQLMGYPRVRTLSRRKCSRCGRFIRPRIVSVLG